MEALKLAFETVIVGALALPWLAFVLNLFFQPGDGGQDQGWSPWAFLKGETGKLGMEIPSAVAGVFLFVAAYFVGVVVTRASGDFFNDTMPSYFPTEDNIRKAVYCDLAYTVEREAGTTELSSTAMGTKTNGDESRKSKQNKTAMDCRESQENHTDIQRLFYLREGALLLEGGDKTDRLNQLHSQILVLRGAAFNGFLTFMLCLFGLGGSSIRRLAWLLWAVPLTIAGLGVYFWFAHTHGLNDPPFMEFTCIVLGMAGGYVLWEGAPEGKYSAGFQLSFLAFWISFLGWWWSELLYDQQVFYSFYAQSQNLLHLTK